MGLLGTRVTPAKDFYVERLARHGIEVIVPRQRVSRWLIESLR